MHRRQFLLAAAGSAVASRLAFAQPKPITIGIVGPRAQSFIAPAIRRGLAELGYREGPTVRVLYLHADGAVERFPKLAQELAAMRCDLIFAIGPEQAPRALLDVRVSAPVVFLAIDYDPLEKKIVQNLVRPGQNMTGVYSQNLEIILKRLEIAREVLPRAKRFVTFSDVYSRDQVAALRKAVRGDTELSVVDFASRPYNYAAAIPRQAEALILPAAPTFADDRAALDQLSLSRRLPIVGFATPEGNFLVGYSADFNKTGKRAAEMGVQILRGAKAGDIPVQLADEFELTVNLKAANAIGIKLPMSVLARATRVIQ